MSDEYDGAGEALYTEADVRAAAELARAQASEVYRVALRVGALGGLSADVVLKALEPAPMPAAQPADDSEGEYTTDEIVAAALELADSDEHPAGALEALAEKLHVGKAWDESKHKRDHGKFSSTGGSGAGSDAKTAGGNKPGKRALKAQKRAEAVQAASALMAQRAKGKPLSHGEAKELLDHMAHLTHDDLRALRKEHGSTFRGERVKGSRVDALVKWARGEDYTRRRGKRGSALQQVVDYGGLDPNSADFKRFYGSMRDAVNDGVPMAAFKRGGQGLDELAAEMVAAGHISIPDWEDPAEHLVGLLRGRKLLHHAADEGHEGRYAEHVAGQLEGDDGSATFDPNKEWDDEDPDWFSKAAPLPDDDTHTPAELLAAAVDVAQRALADGTDPEDGLHALYELAHGDTVQKAWDKDKHPRDDHGRFVSKDAIQAAKSDPKKAAELKKRVTNPEQRKKLDAALEDKEVIGTKRGLAKHETAQKREKVQADRNRARELRIKLADQESRGEELNPDDLREIVPHLATMTHEELSRMRSMLERSGATFGGKRLRADRVAALTQWALDKAAGKTDTPAPEGKPEAESGSGAGESQPARTGSVADILRDVRGTMQITQPRAKPGGEEGPNGEWYPAGAFIATQDLPKRLKDKLKRQATGRVRVRNGLEVPQPGQMSIADKLGGTVMNPRDGSINEQYLDYIKASAEDRQMYAELAEKYKAGGDWVSVNDYPSLARLEDAARLLAAGKPVPGAVLAVLPAEYRERLQKWTPPTASQPADTGTSAAPAAAQGKPDDDAAPIDRNADYHMEQGRVRVNIDGKDSYHDFDQLKKVADAPAPTVDEYDFANHPEFSRLDRVYGHLSQDEIAAKLNSMGEDVVQHYNAGRRASDGDGGARTSASVSAQASRDVARERMLLRLYGEHKFSNPISEAAGKTDAPAPEVKPEAESGSGAGAEDGTELVLWGIPKGETDSLHAKVLYTQGKTEADLERIKQQAGADGWHSFSVQKIDRKKPLEEMFRDAARPAQKPDEKLSASVQGGTEATSETPQWQMRKKEYKQRGQTPLGPATHRTKEDAEEAVSRMVRTVEQSPQALQRAKDAGVNTDEMFEAVKVGNRWGVANTHKMMVATAIAQGRSVPAEVLADYPDLAAKYAKPDAPAPEVKPEAESVSGAGGASDEDILQRALSPSGSRIEDTEHPRYQQIVRAAERAQQEVRGRLSAVSKRFRELMDPDGSLGIADSGASASYHIAQAVRGALAGKPLGSRGVIGDESGKLLPVARGMSAEKPTGLVNARARKLAAELGTPIVPLLVKGKNDEPKGWALVQSPVEFPKGVEFANTIPAGAIDTGDVLFSSAALPKDFRNGMLLPFDNSLDFGTLPLARKYAKPEESGSAAAPAADQDAEDARRAKQHHEAKFSGPVRDEIREYRKLGMDPGTINSGECLPFAQRVIAAIRKKGQQAEFGAPKGDLHHVWVVANGKHYDAQHPDGVDDPKDLTFFQDNPELLSRGWASTPNEPVSDRLARGENVAANIAQDAVAPVPRGTVRTAADTGKPPKTRLQAQAERARAANPPPDPNQEFGTAREQYQAFLRYAHPDDPAQKPDPGAVAEYLSKLPPGAREKLDQHFATAGKSLAQVEAFHRARMAEATPEPTPRATSEQPAAVPHDQAVQDFRAALVKEAEARAHRYFTIDGGGRFNDAGRARTSRQREKRPYKTPASFEPYAQFSSLKERFSDAVRAGEMTPEKLEEFKAKFERFRRGDFSEPATAEQIARNQQAQERIRAREAEAAQARQERKQGTERNAQRIAQQGFDIRKIHSDLFGGDGTHTLADGRKVDWEVVDDAGQMIGENTPADANWNYRYRITHPDGTVTTSGKYASRSRLQDSGELRKMLTAPVPGTAAAKPEPVPGGAPKAPDVSALKRNPRADLDHIERLKGQYPEGAIEREWLDVAKGNAAGVATRDNSALAALHGGDKQHGARHYVLERLASAAAQAHKDGDAAGHTATTNAVTGLGGTLHGAAPGETIAHDPAMYDHPEGAFSGTPARVVRQPVTYRGALVYRGQVEPVGTGAQPPNGGGTAAGVAAKPAPNAAPVPAVAIGANPVSEPTTPVAAAAEPQPGDTPRAVAKRVTEAAKDDYAFARASAVGNAGEDLKGSARHTRNQWRGLEEAEKNGTAAALVTRDSLLKNEPHALSSTVEAPTSLAHLAAHLALSAFPAKPGEYSGGRFTNNFRTPSSPEELRKQYVEAYQAVKAEAERAAAEETDPKQVAKRIQKLTKNIIDKLRDGNGGDRYNPVANALVDLNKKTAVSMFPKATHVIGRVNDFAKRLKEKYPNASVSELLQHAHGHVADVLEGDSFNKTFGTVAGPARFDPSAAYVSNAERKGGRMIDAATVEAGKAHMMNNVGLRGLQWGNSVTDDERQHHLTKSAEAFADLADATGLPDSAISLGGKLGLAIGARGKGGARAHYEQGEQVINLTRAKGVGSLAHEWGHALDHFLTGFGADEKDGGLLSEKVHETIKTREGPIADAMQAVAQAMTASGFRKRLSAEISQHIRDGKLPATAHSYWANPKEMFARTFERFVQHKLHSEGRENTYLTGLHKVTHPLWPDAKEMETLAPAMDKLMGAIRDKHFTGTAAAS